MLGKREIFWSIIWQWYEYAYENTLRANMPRCSMEPCATRRMQSRVYVGERTLAERHGRWSRLSGCNAIIRRLGKDRG